jgi:hypothetical protein
MRRKSFLGKKLLRKFQEEIKKCATVDTVEYKMGLKCNGQRKMMKIFCL